MREAAESVRTLEKQNAASAEGTLLMIRVLFWQMSGISVSRRFTGKPSISCTIELPASLRFDGTRAHPGMLHGFFFGTGVRLHRIRANPFEVALEEVWEPSMVKKFDSENRRLISHSTRVTA